MLDAIKKEIKIEKRNLEIEHRIAVAVYKTKLEMYEKFEETIDLLLEKQKKLNGNAKGVKK